MGGLGYPSGPERGLPPKLAGRGQACGAKSPRVAKSPEARTKVLKRRGGAPRGVAVCLCVPAIRETRRGLLTTRLSALPPPSPFREEKIKLTSRNGARTRAHGCLNL